MRYTSPPDRVSTGKQASVEVEQPRKENRTIHPIVVGDQVWCPSCQQYTDLLRIRRAAKIADVSCKTIYRYVEEGKVHIVKIAGSTIRVCGGCLLKPEEI